MWNEEHAFEISSEKEAMIEVFDKQNVGQDKFMGELKVGGIAKGGAIVDGSRPAMGKLKGSVAYASINVS